ncbi:MAG: hypothetical protein ACYCYG_11790 [Bellilinea sp.]
MIQLNLSTDEIQLLNNLVDSCMEDLRVEIHATDNMGYKEMLRERTGILMKLEAVLKESQSVELAV